MTESRVKLLNDIGFTWKAQEFENVPWENQFLNLLEFKETHGHMLVPKRYDPNPPLGNWVQEQRRQYKKGS